MPDARKRLTLKSWLIMYALIALAVPASARADVWVRPAFGTQFGTTDFDLRLTAVDANGDDTKVRSLLEWPVDVLLVGLDGGLTLPSRRDGDSFLIEGRFETNIGDARGTMEDSDWISSESRGVPPFRFAHTNSDTETRAFLMELGGGYRFGKYVDSQQLALDALVGVRAEVYSMTALGARGEYLDENREFRDVVIPNDVRAADYDVLHVLPFVGGRLVYTPLTQLSLSLLGRVHYLYSYSHDDHLLRNKDAFGRAHGYGLSGSIAPAFHLNEFASLGASAEAYYLNALRGTLEQEFYADDPGTPGDETEGEVPDSDFRVKSVRLQLMAFAKLSF